MVRRFSRSLILFASCLGLLVVAVPQVSAATSQVDIIDLDRLLPRGYGVQATVVLTCDPVAGDTRTYFGLTLWQGKSPKKNYVQGFGGFVEPNQPAIICDGTAHDFSFTVLPTQGYTDRHFRPGPGWVEYQVVRCTQVDPDTTHCVGEELVRERVKIRP